jgi:UDPglucose 6-dehydrogenase
MHISVIGLGKLGSVVAAVLADAGHEVIGVDLDAGVMEAIRNRREPSLLETIERNRSRFSVTTDLRSAVLATEATFVVLPTPSGPDGRFSLRQVFSACESIAGALRQKSTYHLVVISSTVMPGDTEGQLLPAFETCDFGLCYNPEFIALGTAMEDMRHPDLILIGESDERAGAMLEGIYRGGLCGNDPPIARMNFVNAELTKIAINTFVTMKISYANMLAELCERVPGADARVVAGSIAGKWRGWGI